MDTKNILPVAMFVIALIVAIVVGNFVIARIIGIPLDRAPFFLKVIVHGISLGFVGFVGVKYFQSSMS